MKDKLLLNNKVEIRKSSIHGYGVFAKEDIFKGEMIEECKYAIIEPPIKGTIFHYHYPWPKILSKVAITKETLKSANPELVFKIENGIDINQKTIVFGFAAMYNSAESNTLEHNIEWYTDLVEDLYIFQAIHDIAKDEELCIHYPLIPIKKESHGKLGGNLEDIHMRDDR
tara:strand:+ start:277 stop:786 length:510 start_codon:yes stop_codon:yes gene_type:complete